MAHQTFDRIQEYSSSTGTGVFALSGAVVGYRTFGSKLSIGDTCHYLIEAVDAQGVPTGDWETGRGTYTAANQLTRTTVIDSSNAGATVNFVAGTKRTALVILTPITDQARADWQEMLRNDSTPVGSLSYASTSVAPPGWLSMIGGTFGSGASGATVALDATFALFSLWWAGYSDAVLPVFTNAGAGSTRGASALADWNAGKRMTMFDEQGRFRRGIGGAAAAIGTAQTGTGVFDHFSTAAGGVPVLPVAGQSTTNSDGPGLTPSLPYSIGGATAAQAAAPLTTQKVRPDNRAWWPIVKYGYTPNDASYLVGPGRLINVQTFAASGTYTPTPGTRSIKGRGVGGGGGGGGAAAAAAGQIAIGGGGAAGAYGEFFVVNPSPTTVTIGGSVAGGLGNVAGNTGGTTSFGTLAVFLGGTGGPGSPAGATAAANSTPGSLPSGSAVLQVSRSSYGGPAIGYYTTTSILQSGAGGAGAFSGGGGAPTIAWAVNLVSQSGSFGVGSGSGGSGGLTSNGGAAAQGGSGAGGFMIIEEYS